MSTTRIQVRKGVLGRVAIGTWGVTMLLALALTGSSLLVSWHGIDYRVRGLPVPYVYEAAAGRAGNIYYSIRWSGLAIDLIFFGVLVILARKLLCKQRCQRES